MMMSRSSILYLTVTEQRKSKLAGILGEGFADAANPLNDFSLALRQIFLKVISYDFLKSYFEKGAKTTNREIYELAEREKPQYVLWRAHDFHVLESTFQAIREIDPIVIAWFWDDHFRFDHYARLYIPSVDYSVTNDPNAISKYKSLGARCIYSPGVCAGEYYMELDLQKKYDVSFVGTNLWGRDDYVERIRSAGIKVEAFGRGWNSGKLTFNQMHNIFNSSKININFSRVGAQGTKQLKGRIFELTMCGGFVLTEYVPGIERFFKLDKEIVCFRSVEEAVNKIKYYLRYDNEREAIARAGRNRTIQEYTWNKTLPSVFKEIEKDIKINGRPNISRGNLELPAKARLTASAFHYNWGRAWFIINRPDLCRDELEISLKYSKNNLKARRLLIISRLFNFRCLWIAHIIVKIEDAFTRSRNKLRIRTRLRHFLRIQD